MKNISFNSKVTPLPVFWLLGLSGSGKSTLAKMLADKVAIWDYPVIQVDGDEFRKRFNHTGFSREARLRNINAMREYVISLQAKRNVCIVSAITPYREMRAKNAAQIPSYNEIWVKCPMAELIRRDTKGLYAKANKGDLADLTGVGDSFDLPVASGLIIDTSLENREESFRRLSEFAISRLFPGSAPMPTQACAQALAG